MWISGFLKSTRTSVLVNGSPTNEYEINKGVWQGDPLSPFLFIIPMEGLSIAMKTTCENGIFTGTKMPHDDISVSHLFYADDALFLDEWNKENIKNFARTLKCFHATSGLKINFQNSCVFGIGVNMQEVNRWVTPLGCKPTVLPFTYLGVLVGKNMNLKNNWIPIMEKFYNKISSWNAKNLSMRGRLTLTKVVFGKFRLFSYHFL